MIIKQHNFGLVKEEPYEVMFEASMHLDKEFSLLSAQRDSWEQEEKQFSTSSKAEGSHLCLI